MNYQDTVHDRIDEHDWYCDTHGEINSKFLTVSITGQLLCDICEANKIGQPNADISSTVTSKSDPQWNKNENAVPLYHFTWNDTRREAIKMITSHEHDNRSERGKQSGVCISLPLR